MKILQKSHDGGQNSGVTGFWLCEFKSLFSIALLKFNEGSREVFHSHAFNSYSWVLRGALQEERLVRERPVCTRLKNYFPSLKPIFTRRSNCHRVFGRAKSTWVLTFRGPWRKNWKEIRADGAFILSDGRKEKKCERMHLTR
jgi:hypothetical protein